MAAATKAEREYLIMRMRELMHARFPRNEHIRYTVQKEVAKKLGLADIIAAANIAIKSRSEEYKAFTGMTLEVIPRSLNLSSPERESQYSKEVQAEVDRLTAPEQAARDLLQRYTDAAMLDSWANMLSLLKGFQEALDKIKKIE